MKLRLDMPFLSGRNRQISRKILSSSDGRSLSIGMQYLGSEPREFGLWIPKGTNHTILRAIYLPVASPATYDEQNLAQSSARLHYQPQIHGSREKHNCDDLRRRARARCCARHAASKVLTISRRHRGAQACTTSVVGWSRT